MIIFCWYQIYNPRFTPHLRPPVCY